jgi:hypothetical protein
MASKMPTNASKIRKNSYVLGYRGARCRNNLFSLSTGEIVYVFFFCAFL